MKSVVSEKGQVTIPKLLRDRLGIRAGEILDFEEDRGRLVAIKASAPDKVDSIYGIVRLSETTDSLIERMRGPALSKRVKRDPARPGVKRRR
jgi:AbrB family looped-hinge helix DNA binding protein